LSAQFYAEIAHRQPLILGFCSLLAFGAFRMPPGDNFIGLGEQWLDHLLEGRVAWMTIPSSPVPFTDNAASMFPDM
jgi:hypothetical protein